MTPNTPRSQSVSHRLVNDPDRIRAVQDELLTQAEQAGYGKSAAFALRLALEEAIRNAFVHGRKNAPDKPIDVSWSIGPDRVTITVNDHGPGFDPGDVPDPTAPENLERPCGRGLLLMRAYMSSVEYNDAGNEVTMRYEPGAD